MARTASSALKFDTFAQFPVIGNTQYLYIATDTNLIYRWNGSAYVMVGDGTGTGTVTQINTTGPITGGPITTTGTITTSMATNKLIGRGTAGTGVMEEITLGTNISLTGTTLNVPTMTTSPGGSNTQVQFNDGGTFGGDANFIWDKTNDRVGVQVTTPQVPIHAASVTVTTLTNITIGSASLITETTVSPPGGSGTAIVQLAAPGTPNPVQNLAGSGYIANGQLFEYRVTAYYAATNGTKYISANVSSAGSYTDTINDATTPFSNTVTWTASSDADGYKLEVQINSGGWNDIGDVGDVLSYEDSASSYPGGTFTAWPTTYTSPAGTTTFTFRVYGKTTSPFGATVYSSTYTEYSVDINDTNLYVIDHTLTSIPAGGGKILGGPGYTNGIDITSSPFSDPGYDSWTAGTTVTPTSYGYSGTDQNRDYKIYSSSLGIFAVTPLVVSTVSGSGSKYVSLSWTLPTGITAVRITRSINGGAYNFFKDVTGSSATDDSTDTTWASGSTVTPNSYIGGVARFDKALTTLTNQAQLAIVETGGSGARYSKISFGTAADSASVPAYQTHIYSDSSTSFLYGVASRFLLTSSVGGTITTELGSQNIINKGQSSTIHFDVRGQTDAALINTRSDWDTVFFGTAGGGDPSATVQIQPARSTDLAIILRGHGSMTATTTLFRTNSSVGTAGAEITVGGHVWATGGNTTNPSHSFLGDKDTGFYNVTTDVLGIVTGGTERVRITSVGISIGTAANPTARLTLAAGGTGANTSPIKMTSGALNSSPEIGAHEFLTDKIYVVITTGTARKEIALNDIALTTGRIALTTTNGRLTDLSTITYTAGVITATGFTGALNGTLGATTPAAAIVTSLQADTITNDTGLAAGTYSPTVTAEANLDATTTATEAQYMRVGNTITVSGRFTANPTLAVTATSFELSLPVASNIGAVEDCSGVAACGTIAGQSAAISGSVANNTAVITWVSGDVTSQAWSYTYTYQVI